MVSDTRSSNRTANDIAEATRRDSEEVTRAFSEATERAARTGAEAFQRNAERFNDSWRNGSEAANRLTERAMEQVNKTLGLSGKAARRTLQQSSGNVQAILESTTIIADNLQDLSAEWLRFAQERLERNAEHFNQLFGCRSPQDCISLHTRIARENLEALLQTAHRASERATKSMDESVRKISETSVAPD